jgi:predicted CXXCH cytochrome family protein
MQPRRNPKLGLPTAALLGLALAWAWPGGAADTVLGVHAMLDCRDCHVVGADGAPMVPIELVGTQEAICGMCHRDAIEASHSTGFVPKRPLPKAYPLDREGRLTCSTCHELHGQAAVLLRAGEPGRDFCGPCHTAE